MKLVKNFVFAALLVSAITVQVAAGEQDTPASKPPEKAVATSDEGTAPICDPYTEQFGGILTAETSDYLIFEAWTALLSVY
jgi:hypothetical protein